MLSYCSAVFLSKSPIPLSLFLSSMPSMSCLQLPLLLVCITIIDTIILTNYTNDAYICSYLFSSNKVDEDDEHNQPRDESWALNTWENRCRRFTRSVQVSELHKMRLFIYIPYAEDQIWFFNLVYIYGIR
jgi:hypothetical protein